MQCGVMTLRLIRVENKTSVWQKNKQTKKQLSRKDHTIREPWEEGEGEFAYKDEHGGEATGDGGGG